MATKTAQILEYLSDENKSMTQRELAKKLNCSETYVSKVKQEYLKQKVNPPVTPETKDPDVTETEDPDDSELNEVSSFVNKVKLIPPKEILTDNEEPEEDEDYQCGACGHTWMAPKTEYQGSCPACGEVF